MQLLRRFCDPLLIALAVNVKSKIDAVVIAVVSSCNFIKLRVREENVDAVTEEASVCALGSFAVSHSNAPHNTL